MTDFAAASVHDTGRFAIRRIGRKWSRQSSFLAIGALSLLGWAAIGVILQHVLR